MFDVKARQKWLREASAHLAEVYKNFENNPIAKNDSLYDGWIICADVFSAQFLTRAKLYDEPLVQRARNDQELREAVAECLHKKQQEASQKSTGPVREGCTVSDDVAIAGHFSLCYGYELEFILNATLEKKAEKCEGSNGRD